MKILFINKDGHILQRIHKIFILQRNILKSNISEYK